MRSGQIPTRVPVVLHRARTLTSEVLPNGWQTGRSPFGVDESNGVAARYTLVAGAALFDWPDSIWVRFASVTSASAGIGEV
jgi:hypothetical protein